MSKKIIGVDVGSYTFIPASKQIVLNGIDFNLSLEQISLITNVTDNIIIYNFAKSGAGGTISSNIITLDYDTTPMSADDNLLIYVEDGEMSGDAQGMIETITSLCRFIKQFVLYNARPAWWDASSNRLRQTAVIESGTITTVITCATVSNIALMNSWQAHLQIINNNMSSWYIGCRSKIV
jgi:hypothetical protein